MSAEVGIPVPALAEEGDAALSPAALSPAAAPEPAAGGQASPKPSWQAGGSPKETAAKPKPVERKSSSFFSAPAVGVPTKEPPLQALGCGSGGIDQMRELLDDDDAAVRWAYLKFELGSGGFRRQKSLFLHINGERCPAVKRGRANQYTSLVQSSLCGSAQDDSGPKSFHASLTVLSKAEVTTEQLLGRVMPFFTSDNLGDHSVQWLMSSYDEQITEASNKSNLGNEKRGSRIPAHESTALFSTGRDALSAVGDPVGPWNWVIVKPEPNTLPLVEGGMGSIIEMKECIARRDNEALAGLLRMNFGDGRLRRTKHVLVFAVGDRAGAVARGRLAAARTAMEKALGELVPVSCVLEVIGVADLTLEAVIERVRRASHIDDEVLDNDEANRRLFSADAFREALDAERRSSVKAPRKRTSSVTELNAKEVIELVHTDRTLNWALFGLKDRPPSSHATMGA